MILPYLYTLWYSVVHSNIMAKKINTSMNLDEDLLKWVDSQITKKRFAHRTHAVEYALQKLKEESK
jgi:metal-responsive CopG/Arc/MetJ family transcriptional regulator